MRKSVFAALFGIGAALGLAVSTGAHAATVNFQISGSQFARSLSTTSDGIGITATAATWDLGGFSSSARTGGTGRIKVGGKDNAARLHASSYGLALINSRTDNTHLIDGSGLNDIVLFEFTEQVRLDTILFNFVDKGDHFALFVGDSVDTLEAFSFQHIMSSSIDAAGTVALNVIGRVFAIGALDSDDGFKIKNLAFSRLNQNPPAVPLPGALPLMAVGLASLGFARRQRRSA